MLSVWAGQRKAIFAALRSLLLAAIPAVGLAACREEPVSDVPEIRPVRTVTVEKRESGVPVVLTGRIESADEAALGFRIAGG